MNSKVQLFLLTIAGLIFATTRAMPQGNGYALQFDGVDDYVNVPYNSTIDIGSSLTVELWIKANLTQSSGDCCYNVIDKSHSEGGWTLQGSISTGRLAFIVSDGHGGFPSAETQVSILDDTWHHIAGVLDGSNVIIYLDGIVQETSTFSGSAVNSMAPLNIGRWEAGASRYFRGTIDEVNIWNFARTQSEIQQTMHTTLLGSEQGLVAYWRFDEGSGSTTCDLSAHGNRGLLHNGVAWTPSTAPVATLTPSQCVPILTQLGWIILSVLIALTGMWMMRKYALATRQAPRACQGAGFRFRQGNCN